MNPLKPPKAKAMVLGTFHMRATDDMFNVEVDDLLGPKRQSQIQEVCRRLIAFRPSKIAVEVLTEKQGSLNEEYRAHLLEHATLQANEVHQFGFRLASELGHDRVYAVDRAGSPSDVSVGDVYTWTKERDSALFREIFGELPPDSTVKPRRSTTILDVLRACNDPSSCSRMHRMYVNLARIGARDCDVGTTWLRWWYERNLMIFANMARLIESDGERILLVIGASHIHLVSQFMVESGCFDLELADDYLRREES
jgi:hypothetical protein